MRWGLAALGLVTFCAVAALAGFAARDPFFRHDLAQAPGEAARAIPAAARSVARSIGLASRPDVIPPERLRWNSLASEYDLTLYRYVSTDPWITDGASLTFRFPRPYVLTNLVSGSGAVPEAPILVDYDTSRPAECGRDCKRAVFASVGFRSTGIASPPSVAALAKAIPLPDGGVARRQVADALYELGERHCGLSLYETNGFRDDDLPFPFDRARVFHREGAPGAGAAMIECSVENGGGACRTVADYELGARMWVAFPLPLLCDADKVLHRARKIFDDHTIAPAGPVPGWGRIAD
jgi:hypothetical protein